MIYNTILVSRIQHSDSIFLESQKRNAKMFTDTAVPKVVRF